VAIDSSGNVYMTDLTYSGIWKISPDGKKVGLWSAHPLLNWSPKPYSGFPLGVNDLVLDKQQKNIYAVTDGDPRVLKIPIREDGTAGEPSPLPYGFSAFDGIELDGKGNIYVSEILLNQIWVLSPDGSQRILIATKQNAPLDNNTSLVLKGDVTLYSQPWAHPRETRGSRPNGGLHEGFPAAEIVGLWKSSRQHFRHSRRSTSGYAASGL
jgi:sugar lactone lactonase YvrE